MELLLSARTVLKVSISSLFRFSHELVIERGAGCRKALLNAIISGALPSSITGAARRVLKKDLLTSLKLEKLVEPRMKKSQWESPRKLLHNPSFLHYFQSLFILVFVQFKLLAGATSKA